MTRRLLLLLGACAALTACRHRIPVDPFDGGEAPPDGPAATWPDGARRDVNPAAAGYIYVVDLKRNLRRYHPTTNTFSLIGRLNCPATSGTPFSMSVDQDARAWVLYDDGAMYWADTKTAACTRSKLKTGQHGFNQFGMGFVADGPGAPTEKLFIAGARFAAQDTDLGYIDVDSLVVSKIGTMKIPENSPELTGTANGELYGYFPGTGTSVVARIDKASAKMVKTWHVPPAAATVTGWAFAHWGGKFYIFVTAGQSRVMRLDPVTGKTTTMLAGLPFVIVGAGVSSVAPVTFPEAGADLDGG